MSSKIKNVQDSQNPQADIFSILRTLHEQGPVDSDILETIALYKEFHPDAFAESEEKIISSMGLFYKIKSPSSIYSLLLGSAVGEKHKAQYGVTLTPVQASVRRAVDSYQFVSISAPTSAGKSYSIRDFIAEQTGDAVIIVPSRALIAEYLASIRSRFAKRKDVMISSFVDKIFTTRDLRRIFVLTPERARELFLVRERLDIKVFFFDEAQVSEEKVRGVVFDILVRRIKKSFPASKLIFAHPFVNNPGAQFTKHNIDVQQSYARSYTHGSVGRVSIFRHANDDDFYFTPSDEKGYLLSRCVKFDGGFEKFAFNGHHSILIFVSKASIYNGKFLEGFGEYIDGLRNVTNPDALEIVEAIEHILGADENEHRSRLVSLLRKGVVIHHGSVPLDVRFLLEKFIRGKFAKICFATSTLAQGVNMPFDIVWLRSNRILGSDEEEKALSFKNLVGRAGRLSEEKKFDYGYVFTDNPKLYIKRINGTYSLRETSIIDSDFSGDSFDTRELIESIRDETFDDDLNLPRTRAERLLAPHVLQACQRILDLIYRDGTIRENLSGDENKEHREILRACFSTIFEASINRKMFDGEAAVFKTALMIFLLAAGGRTFREIAGIRYSNVSRRDEGRKGMAAFSQQASKLPDSGLVKAYPLFKDVLAKDVSYDAVIFDTYDYMDQVISFSLSDVFSAAFKIYGEATGDSRAAKMLELLRFGTNNVIHILLLRYGFSPETISDITPYLQFVTEQEIIFKDEIYSAPQYILDMVEWYLPR
jgi:helicase